MSNSISSVEVPKIAADFQTWDKLPKQELAKNIAAMQAMLFNFSRQMKELKFLTKLDVPFVASCWLEHLASTTALVRSWIIPVQRLLDRQMQLLPT